jgi:hypothetical protein
MQYMVSVYDQCVSPVCVSVCPRALCGGLFEMSESKTKSLLWDTVLYTVYVTGLPPDLAFPFFFRLSFVDTDRGPLIR